MNCREFDDVVYALAEPQNQAGGTGDPDEFLDDATWREAVGHAESCPSCARLLTDAHSLRAGLAAMGAAGRAIEAPARIESFLVGEFAKQQTAAPVRAWLGSPPGMRRTRWVRWNWAMAALTVIALLLFAGWQAWNTWNRLRPSADSQVRSSAHREATATVKTSSSEAPRQQPVPGRHRSLRSLDRKASSITEPSAAAEYATAFLPLEYDGDLDDLSHADLVRVELPPSALAYFGLGIGDDPTGTVTAELLVSQDGTPQAVRFLR